MNAKEKISEETPENLIKFLHEQIEGIEVKISEKHKFLAMLEKETDDFENEKRKKDLKTFDESKHYPSFDKENLQILV